MINLIKSAKLSDGVRACRPLSTCLTEKSTMHNNMNNKYEMKGSTRFYHIRISETVLFSSLSGIVHVVGNCLITVRRSRFSSALHWYDEVRIRRCSTPYSGNGFSFSIGDGSFPVASTCSTFVDYSMARVFCNMNLFCAHHTRDRVDEWQGQCYVVWSVCSFVKCRERG